jgi:hypothetical protein
MPTNRSAARILQWSTRIITVMTDATTSTTPSAATTGLHEAATGLLAAIAAGTGIPAELYADDAVVDATVPGWRYSMRGAAAVASGYSTWFAAPAELEELERLPVADGEMLTYLLTWEENGVPHAAHHCHRLRFDDDGRISFDRVFCGGRWSAALLAEMAAACDAD